MNQPIEQTQNQPDFITASDVAKLTGFSGPIAFLNARSRLEREEGFPRPMPTCLRPMKWRRDAITAWVDEQNVTVATIEQLPSNVVLLRAAQTA